MKNKNSTRAFKGLRPKTTQAENDEHRWHRYCSCWHRFQSTVWRNPATGLSDFVVVIECNEIGFILFLAVFMATYMAFSVSLALLYLCLCGFCSGFSGKIYIFLLLCLRVLCKNWCFLVDIFLILLNLFLSRPQGCFYISLHFCFILIFCFFL